MEGPPLPLREWVYAIYLDATSLKGVSSMKLHRNLGVTQRTAWHMQQRIREAFAEGAPVRFEGLFEADEIYIGGKRKNMPKHKREALTGRGTVGKVVAVGIRDRMTGNVAASAVERIDSATLRSFVGGRTALGAQIYTDDASAYRGLPNHRRSDTLGVGVRGRHGPHQRTGVLLGDAEARLPWDVPSLQRQTRPTIRKRVCRPSQHLRLRHHRANGVRVARHGGQAASLFRTHRLAIHDRLENWFKQFRAAVCQTQFQDDAN